VGGWSSGADANDGSGRSWADASLAVAAKPPPGAVRTRKSWPYGRVIRRPVRPDTGGLHLDLLTAPDPRFIIDKPPAAWLPTGGGKEARAMGTALAARIPLGCSHRGAGQQLLVCPALDSYGTAACSLANLALSWRASAFRLSLDPLTPPLRSARRDTGFPAVTSLRATKDA
jgi:hypothetical protein